MNIMNPEDALLCFIAEPGGPYQTDRIRVMKGMFLLAMGDDPNFRDVFDFQPYAYGPFCADIYHSLESLEAKGLITAQETPPKLQIEYRPTSRGISEAQALVSALPPKAREVLQSTKRLVTTKGFSALLRFVYDRYPAYATKSIARR